MHSLFSFVKGINLITTLSARIVVMASSASSSYNVYIPKDVIPTAETKITLAGRILVSPLSQLESYRK